MQSTKAWNLQNFYEHVIGKIPKFGVKREEGLLPERTFFGLLKPLFQSNLTVKNISFHSPQLNIDLINRPNYS